MAGDVSRDEKREEKALPAYSAAKTSVWWDIENCQVPKGCDPHAIAQSINSALAKMNYRGPLSISAYCDTNRIPPWVQQALSSTGISLNHVPADVKDASDKKILVDMLFWAVDNPAPANFLLISGDRDFSNALHQLRLRRYNILLAKPEKASAPLIAAASTVWLWTSLATGGAPLSSDEVAQHANTKTNFNPRVSLSRNYEQVEFPQQQKAFHAENSSANSSSWASQQRVFDSESLAADSSGRAGDTKFIGNYFHNNPNQPTLSRPSNAPFTNLNQPQQTQAKQFRKAPHEFFNRKDPGVSASSSTAFNGQFGGPQGSNYICNLQNHPTPHPLPNNLPSQQRSNRSDNVLFPISQNFHSYLPMPRPYGLAASSTTNMNVSDFTKLSLSDCSNYGENHPNMQDGPASNQYSYAMDCQPPLRSVVITNTGTNGNRESKRFPPTADNLQGNMRIILLALDTLKTEKIMPTEANITDCIHFGDLKGHNMDVRKALDSAVENNLVVKQNVGALLLYVGKNDKLWKCVNPSCGNFYQYPKAMWDEIRNFLTSAVGRSIIMASHCRYEAALILKKSCLENLPLGEVLQIMSIVISYKKWITHHPSEWHPVTITLEEGKAGASDTASI